MYTYVHIYKKISYTVHIQAHSSHMALPATCKRTGDGPHLQMLAGRVR